MWSEKVSEMLVKSGYDVVQSVIAEPVFNYLNEHDEMMKVDPFLLVKNFLDVEGPVVLGRNDVREALLSSLDKKGLKLFCDEFPFQYQENLVALVGTITAKGWIWNSEFSNKFCEFFSITDAISEYNAVISNEECVPYPNTLDQESVVDGFYELHGYQSNMRDAFLHSINKGNKKILLRLPTGGGKTRVAIHTLIKTHNFINNKKGTSIWLAYDKLLISQACEQFCNIWKVIGRGKTSLTKVFEPYDDNLFANADNQMLFSTIIKLSNRLAGGEQSIEELSKKVKLIVFDEVHQLQAATAFDLIHEFLHYNPEIIVLGLTATPGRGDLTGDDTAKLAGFFDDKIDIEIPSQSAFGDTTKIKKNKEEMTAIKYLQEMKVLAKINEIRHDYKDSSNPMKPENDPKRNKLIITETIKRLDMNEKVLLFASSASHAKALASLFKLKEYNVGLVLSENSISRTVTLDKFIKGDKLNLLINYGVLSTGFDAPCINTVIISRVTGSIVLYSQILGRALRGPLNGGHEINTIINISDPRVEDVSKVYDEFKNYWSKEELNV